MFMLQRSFRKSSKSRDKLDFAFSDFKLLQVPKGWEKLFLSLVSVETGKSVAKLNSALVKNGICQWGQTFSHSIYIARDDCSISKDCDQGLVKLLVSSGKTRNSTLGEVTINLAEWTGSSVASEISLPLKRCSHGTVLEMKVECLTPLLKISYEESEYSSFREPNLDLGCESTERKSSVSDYASPLKSDSEEETQSQYASIQAFDSLDGSIRSEDLSMMSILEAEECLSSVENDSPSNKKAVSSGMCLLTNCTENGIDHLTTEAQLSKKNTTRMMSDLDGMALENAIENQQKLSTDASSDDSETLLLQLQKLKDSEKRLRADIRLLEETLSHKNGNDRAESQGGGFVECESSTVVDSEALTQELESLRGKVQELENDCEELTSENLELVIKINELTKRGDRQRASTDSNPNDDFDASDPTFPTQGVTERKSNEEKTSSPECAKCFPLILKQIHMAFRFLGKPRIQSCDEIDLGSVNSGCLGENSSSKVPADYVLSLLQEMNELLEMRSAESDDKNRAISNAQTKLDTRTLELQEQQRSKTTTRENYPIDLLSSEGMLDADIQDFCLDGQHLLHDRIMELQIETEVQILTLKQVSEDVHRDWLVAQEENQILIEEIKALKLHAACSRKEATNIQRRNSELHEKCSSLAEQLYESRECLSDCVRKVMSLDDYLSSVVEYFSQREHVVNSTVADAIQENCQWIQKVALLDTTHQALLLKVGELEKEVEYLNTQLIDSHAEKERISFEACSEVSLLLADKALLQAALEESVARAKIIEKNLNQKLQESELKVEGLMIQVAASMKSHERLMIDNEKSLKLLTNYKKSDEKLRNCINELESKLQLTEDKRGVQNHDFNNRSPAASNVDHLSRQRFLESEMDSLRENGRGNRKNSQSVLRGKFNTVVVRNKFDRTKSSLEAELKDLRERYMEMSLKYAEVEAQREDLVMKLKQARASK